VVEEISVMLSFGHGEPDECDELWIAALHVQQAIGCCYSSWCECTIVVTRWRGVEVKVTPRSEVLVRRRGSVKQIFVLSESAGAQQEVWGLVTAEYLIGKRVVIRR